MAQVVIENPILNSPFQEPTRHFRFGEEGITNETVESRRPSSYFIPIAQPKKKGKQMVFDTEWTKDRIEENKFINQIRERVSVWRKGGHVGITHTTRRLLDHWTDPERSRKLFFCQVEAVETAIYIAEVAKKYGDVFIENSLRQFNDDANPDLFRIAFKMATGSGKTVVMSMLIAWQALNKLAEPQDARFTDAFLVVTPGITIRDRLRVLFPNDPENYYRKMDLLSPDDAALLGKAKIIVTNFHSFKLRDKMEAGRLVKNILQKGGLSGLTETPDEMVRRVCRELGAKKNIIVINDEAHHCYRRKPDGEDDPLVGEERREAQKREEEARVWISGLEAVKKKIGVKVIYDLSATPFFLKGSGYSEGTLFPWVVSDFSLIDAIESGIVKIPRVPVADDRVVGEQPTYRELWKNIREALPKKGRGTDAMEGEPTLPPTLEGALLSLYGNYEKFYKLWESSEARAKGLTPPVFIVVCNNTNVSNLVYRYVAGWDKIKKDGTPQTMAGRLDLFRNESEGKWKSRPNTILIDSEQLESGEGLSSDFKKIAELEINEFKEELRQRFPGRDMEEITDDQILREVMNTVGKPGKLGENIRCVVSVSMLTEGWDANTVTHILGVRAFGTQLLCEQVIGRGLRRMSYVPNDAGFFEPEYAEVYGVPFSFIPCSGAPVDAIKVGVMPTRVRALTDRAALEITFPRLTGYRFDLPAETLSAQFTEDSKMSLSTQDLPTKTQLDPIVGESSYHTLDDLKKAREQQVVFLLARRTLEKFFRDDEGSLKIWLFPSLLEVARRWLAECLVLKDDVFPQMLLLAEFSHAAAEKIYRSIVHGTTGDKTLKPVLQAFDVLGSTKHVDRDTLRPTVMTRANKCHISHVVLDSDWEAKLAQSLEDMEEVAHYVKNFGLGFTIPYTLDGREHAYQPDYIVRVNDGHPDLLNLVLEVSGEKRKDKAAKVGAAKTLWVPSVNNHGGFGRWAFLEITDPWNAKNAMRDFLKTEVIR
jgi:type III restriction enzyme